MTSSQFSHVVKMDAFDDKSLIKCADRSISRLELVPIRTVDDEECGWINKHDEKNAFFYFTSNGMRKLDHLFNLIEETEN